MQADENNNPTEDVDSDVNNENAGGKTLPWVILGSCSTGAVFLTILFAVTLTDVVFGTNMADVDLVSRDDAAIVADNVADGPDVAGVYHDVNSVVAAGNAVDALVVVVGSNLVLPFYANISYHNNCNNNTNLFNDNTNEYFNNCNINCCFNSYYLILKPSIFFIKFVVFGFIFDSTSTTILTTSTTSSLPTTTGRAKFVSFSINIQNVEKYYLEVYKGHFNDTYIQEVNLSYNNQPISHTDPGRHDFDFIDINYIPLDLSKNSIFDSVKIEIC
ncbi:hypothetical protein HELRODRAFT_178261 [Helobdella robusta]|uniref:Uncharacterized protein n=1 Tax=Helobdella robusta TaxID=6412 RepID=T1FD02_HELRO|nr:hypothetical protein HELRODRAFT_178261 [Helobdella robusta]ESN97153.1 hypothetical protein HELRODRAFT_178261 [Helobdella robusta]